ncbi:hypothetical protein [Enemella sp. A6]|uniref:hypothetical protein n=1 Tax=Enemella sp. A6 TaxID=3440152 RepID=UPI003EB77F91
MAYEDGLWSLQVNPISLDSRFVSATRLFINQDHASSASLLESGDDSHIFRFLQLDVARQLMHAVARLKPSDSELMADWEEGTIGQVAQEMASDALGTDLVTCIRLIDHDLVSFELMLQSAFRPWETT